MVISSSSEKMDVFEDVVVDHSIVSLHEHTYKPYGSPYYRNSDDVRFCINFLDAILDISNSYIYIEGKFEPSDPTKSCYLSNNALAFLFDDIRLEMGGEQLASVRKPGITTALKTMVSFGQTQAPWLSTAGWGLSVDKQHILDTNSHIFSGRLPLKYLMGFAEDYTKGVLNGKLELILIIARSFKNSYIGEVEANLEISKIEWKIKHIVPDDRQKLKLMNRINKGVNHSKIKLAYRSWDLFELPSLRQTSSDIWSIKTCTSLERPRFIILAFQSNTKCEQVNQDATSFTHANISNIRLFLNSEVYPYERWNLDFDKKLDALAYYSYEDFQRSYYDREAAEPMMDLEAFRKNPVFVIDCSHQQEAVKASTVDVKIELDCGRSKFPEQMHVYALILHDTYKSYNALDGTIQKVD